MVQIPNPPPSDPSAPRSVPTSADVARLAGVSRATVSYVLNNTGTVRISEPTRRRVREAARQLGYVPHAAARSLRAGHSRMVLMPAPSFPAGPLYSRFLSELQWALGRLDYTVVQYGTVGLRGDEAARAWAELRPVAVLAPGSDLGPQGVEVLKRSGARAVVTLGPEAVDGAHALLTDQAGVGRSATATCTTADAAESASSCPRKAAWTSSRRRASRAPARPCPAPTPPSPSCPSPTTKGTPPASRRAGAPWGSTRCSRTTTSTRCC